jgi:hypothetical protein
VVLTNTYDTGAVIIEADSVGVKQLLLIIFVGGICCLNIPNKMLCTQKMVIWSSFKQQQQQKTNNGM